MIWLFEKDFVRCDVLQCAKSLTMIMWPLDVI